MNIASLFQCEHETVTPEQYLDEAKNVEHWSHKDDSKLIKAFQKYQNNWVKISEELSGKKTVRHC